MREHEDAMGAPLFLVYLGKDGEGQDDDGDKGPDTEADNLGCSVGAVEHLPGLGGGCHNEVSVNAHDSQKVNAGDNVVLVYGDDELAHELSKGPLQEQVVSNVDGQHQGKELTSNGQVEDEDVGYCFHLWCFEDDIDDNSVACQSHGTDDRVDDRHCDVVPGGYWSSGHIQTPMSSSSAVCT